MKPFFLYFGGKHRLAKQLGPPRYDLVIEACGAGSAGYSVYWEPAKVILIDVDPIICGIWRYLLKVKPKEIMRIPSQIMHVNELPSWVPQEARWLCGFWLNSATQSPGSTRSNWARQPKYAFKYWSETIKSRIAAQLPKVQGHWQIIEGSYENAPDIQAHWHIDPPYSTAGKTYRHHEIDYPKLATWCRSRKGFVQVCESSDEADWLPFQPYALIRTPRGRGFSAEGVWESESAARILPS